MVTYATSPVIDAVLTTLATAEIAAGDGIKPDDAGWQGAAGTTPFVGYCVVYLIGNRFDGSLDVPFDDGAPLVQISSWGHTGPQARLIGDKAAAALLTTPIVVTGRHVMLVERDDFEGNDRFDDLQPPLWCDKKRFRIHTTTT